MCVWVRPFWERVPVCLNVMSIYFSVYSQQVCLFSAREQAPAPTDTCNMTWEHWGGKKHHVLFMYFTVTNHSHDSHHWEILWYTVCYTGIYMYLYAPKGDLLYSFSDSYLYFWLLLEHVYALKWSEKLYFTHTVCAGTSEVTLCLNRTILTPVNFSPPPKNAQSALYLHPWHLCQAHRNSVRR